MTGRFLSLAMAVLLSSVAPPPLHGQTADGVHEGILLSMPEPPESYTVTKERIEAEEKLLGFKILVLKEGSASKIIISVETFFDRSTRPARVAATKGYVNGLAVLLKEAGFDLTEIKLPDLEQETFTETVQVDMTFANSDGLQFHTRQFIFFTDKGYNVQIASTEMRDVESLTTWAKHIKAASLKAGLRP